MENALSAFENLKTKTGKACLLGQFTARGLTLYKRRMAELEEN